ncbi:hypothetical protein V6N13_020895 [Hibiscus sabdariffa]|uniref:Uncharacterized protein n=1 Tax=Hibiscus sabdariffa TaxID=183260 RepID=A0ABR2EUW2_9ROSI
MRSTGLDEMRRRRIKPSPLNESVTFYSFGPFKFQELSDTGFAITNYKDLVLEQTMSPRMFDSGAAAIHRDLTSEIISSIFKFANVPKERH